MSIKLRCYSGIESMVVGAAMLCAQFGAFQASGAVIANGGEYAPAGLLPSDQAKPEMVLGASGGVIAWQQNGASADGSSAIFARRLGRNLSGLLTPFQVNSNPLGDHTLPKVVALKNGGAAFAWQGVVNGRKSVFARILLPPTGSAAQFQGADIEVSPSSETSSGNPALAVLTDGSLVVAWESLGGDGDGLGVYAQRLSSVGAKLGSPILVNVTVASNQRSPAVASLVNGQYAVAWISENQRSDRSADLYGRIFTLDGSPTISETRLNYGTNLCSDPHLSALPQGGFAAVWGEFNLGNPANDWDIYARSFDASAMAPIPSTRVNTYQISAQTTPRIAVASGNIFVTWTSLGQNGSGRGIYGRNLDLNAQPLADDVLINQTSDSRQLDPVIASDGNQTFVASWTSFSSVDSGYDLVARQFAVANAPLAASCKLVPTEAGFDLSWSTQAGQQYQLYGSGDLSTWTPIGSPRVATGTSDAVPLPKGNSVQFFRISSLP